MSARKQSNAPPVAMTPEQIAEYKRQALERYEQQQRQNTASGRTSPQRATSPRKSSRTAVSLTPEQIAEYKKQAQDYYTATKSGEAPSSPPTTALLSPRKQAALEASPVMQPQSPQATEGAQANWTRKKSVLTPIPPAELLAAMAAQSQAEPAGAPRSLSSRSSPQSPSVSTQAPLSARKPTAAEAAAQNPRTGSDRPVSPRSRGLSNFSPEQIAELKAKAQQDYERQQRENEELRKQIASGARKPTAAAQMLTPEQIAEYKLKAQQDYERQLRENAAHAPQPTSPRVHMDPEQAAEYKRKMQEEYERQQRENDEIRKRKEEEARLEAAARANMTPEQIVEYKRKMQEEYERQQRENEEVRRRKEEEARQRAVSPARSNMTPEEVAEYKRQALIKYEQQRRENERSRKQKEDEAKQAMAGTFTRQSMAPNAMRRQAQQAGGPVQLVDDLVDDQPPSAMQARTSPQRGLSYIEIPPIKAERRQQSEPALTLEEQERIRPVQVSPRLAGGAKARNSARMKTVLVTGATGFVGSHAVKALMTAGYRVKALIRRLNYRPPSLLQTLRDLAPGSANPLQIVEGDLTVKGSLDECIKGVDMVVHCAGVMNFAPADPFADMLQPVVLGTLNLLTAAKAAKTVEKFVIVSCVAAVHDVPDAAKIYDESSWNEIAKIDSNPYAFAKVEQESNANKFLNQLPEAERFDLVFLNPTTVLGPLLTRELRSTSEIVYHLMAGNLPLVPHWGTGVVDVRDVARAVVAALERPNVQGRYILNGRSTWLVDLAKELAALFPTYNVGTRVAPTLLTLALPMLDSKLSFNYLWSNLGSIAYYDTGRSKAELGMAYTPFEDTLHDAGESIIQLGLLPNKTTGDEASTPTAPSFSAYRPAEEDGFFSRVSKMFW